MLLVWHTVLVAAGATVLTLGLQGGNPVDTVFGVVLITVAGFLGAEIWKRIVHPERVGTDKQSKGS